MSTCMLMCVYVSICEYMYVCMCVCECVFMCVFVLYPDAQRSTRLRSSKIQIEVLEVASRNSCS